jgi:hypothetical protein
MDEIGKSKSVASKMAGKIKAIFVIEPVAFSNKKQINFRGIAWLSAIVLAVFCIGVLFVPPEEEQTRSFNDRRASMQTSTAPVSNDSSSPEQSLNPSAIRNYLAGHPAGGMGGSSQVNNRNTSMVIPHDGDSSTTLPPGTKFWVQLSQGVTVTTRTIPVIGVVVSTVESRSSVAIPETAEIYGEATLDQESSRASITWKSILFPDGRSKTLNALALGPDNQAGVEGVYHSDAVKNTAGQMVSHFVEGFAEGAINRGPFGANQGGVQNGLLQGAADTAKDRTNAWSEDLKKPKEWVELQAGSRFQVILSQPFVFRDPGGVY